MRLDFQVRAEAVELIVKVVADNKYESVHSFDSLNAQQFSTSLKSNLFHIQREIGMPQVVELASESEDFSLEHGGLQPAGGFADGRVLVGSEEMDRLRHHGYSHRQHSAFALANSKVGVEP